MCFFDVHHVALATLIAPGCTCCRLLADEPVILTDESELLTDESLVLADVAELLTNQPVVLADEPELLADEPLLLADESELLTNESELQPNEPELQPDESLVLADVAELLAERGGGGQGLSVNNYARRRRRSSWQAHRCYGAYERNRQWEEKICEGVGSPNV